MTVAELRERRHEFTADDELYILQDKEGDYVSKVEGTGWETVKVYFSFTKNKEEARVFTHQDLYWKQATNPIGVLFAQGFAGSRAIRVQKK